MAIDLRDIILHLGMIMSECIFVEAYHFAWFFFLLGHDLSLDEVRYLFHITTMTLRSTGDSFWSDDVWLVVLLLSMFALEMLTLGHSPPIGDGFCEISVYARHIFHFPDIVLHFRLTHFERMHFDIETWPSIYDCHFQWITEMMIFLG